MATRSTIALEFADGTVQQVYCHWDGYLSNNGVLLQNNYSDPFKLRELIDLGDVSSLRPTVGTQHAFSQFETEMSSEDYDKLYGEMTTFYGRDRGEKGTDARKFKDFADYVENFAHEEYAYILRTDGLWYVKQYSKDFEPLVAAIAKEKIAEEECAA
jgi:hypothetical protein